MRLVLFEPVDGPVTFTARSSGPGTLAVGTPAVPTDTPQGPVSRVCLTLPEPGIPAGAVPATDSRGRVVGYAEESP